MDFKNTSINKFENKNKNLQLFKQKFAELLQLYEIRKIGAAVTGLPILVVAWSASRLTILLKSFLGNELVR